MSAAKSPDPERPGPLNSGPLGSGPLNSGNERNTHPHRQNLHRAIEGLCLLCCAHISDAKQVLELSVKIRRAVRRLIHEERRRWAQSVKADMLAHPIWRARVLQDLGGPLALLCWSKRWQGRWQGLRKTRAVKGGSPAPASIYGNSPAEQTDPSASKLCKTKARVRLDRSGLFRLAPIARGPRRKACLPTPTPALIPAPTPAPAGAHAVTVTKHGPGASPRYAPIPLIPQDFIQPKSAGAAPAIYSAAAYNTLPYAVSSARAEAPLARQYLAENIGPAHHPPAP